jgi:hypothetical protein
MTDRELVQQALDAFGGLLVFNPSPAEYKQGRDVVAALRERLAQPEQEPVMFLNNQPLYITPPQRRWVGLTDEEIMDCTHHMTKGENETWVVTDSNLFEFAHILEEWLKGKNK